MSHNPEKPHWMESVWSLPKALVEDFTTRLISSGSLGSYEKMELTAEAEEMRTQSEVIAYFPDTNDPTALRKTLSALETDLIRLAKIERIPQAEWATAWRQYFKPFFLTKDIVIRPSWEPYEVTGTEKVVTLDPGMAFGTGQHDTTRFCAELLCELRAKDPSARSLLDVGCGSGILSIIAKKVGFDPVTGIDIEEPAIETANENLERNPDVGPIDFHLTDGGLKAPFLKTYDVVVSNIIAETLCELKNDLVALAKPDGYLILSGILPERGELVKAAFRDQKLLEERTSKDWHAYLYRRQ